MQYTSLELLKKRLWIDENTTTHDEELSLIIERATNIITSHIWDISKQTLSERVDAHGTNRIYLKYMTNTVMSIQSLSWAHYELDYIDGYILYLKQSLPKKKKSVLVEYEIGYEKVPSDIEEICLDLATIFVSESHLDVNTEKLIDKNIKTKKLWDLMITYFWENEKSASSKDILNPTKNIQSIFQKYKPFIWLHS